LTRAEMIIYTLDSMVRLALIVTFLGTVVINSMAAVTPHPEGEGGCSLSCCQEARRNEPGSSFSKLCCALDCKQPAGTHAAASTISISELRLRGFSLLRCDFASEVLLSTRRVAFPSSPTRSIAGSTDRYLEIGTLLI